MKSISAVIVSYHTGPILFESIASALRQKGISQVIVVDNGNPPSVVNTLKLEFSSNNRFQLISGHGNIGFSRGCNLGAERVRGKYILLLNPDCIIPDNGIKLLSRASESLKGKWLLAPRLVNPDGTDQQGARREILTPWIAFVEGVKLYKVFPNHPYFKRFDHKNEEVPSRIVEIPVTSGACLLIKTLFYRELGGFDEKYFLHVEDIDFCMRFRKAGGKIYFCPQATFMHVLGTSKVRKLFVEWNKLIGFRQYFRRHFSNIYPPGFIGLVNGLIAVRFVLIAMKELFKSIARLCPYQRKETILEKEVETIFLNLDEILVEKVLDSSLTPVEHSSDHRSSLDSSV